MPIRILVVNYGLISRIRSARSCCRLCGAPLSDLKIGDYILRKTTKKSSLAHVLCGKQKNWVSDQELEKLNIVPISTQ